MIKLTPGRPYGHQGGAVPPCAGMTGRPATTEVFFAAIVLCAAAGCARLGERVQREPLAAGAPSVREALADLEDNQAALVNFQSGGVFEIEAPELDRGRRFRANIAYRRPGDLSIVARHAVTGASLFTLTSAGKEFLIRFPDACYYQLEGETVENLPFSVSPSDVAHEMFLPEDWSRLRRRDVRLEHYDPASGHAVLAIGEGPRRRIEVAGPPWDIVRNERYEAGELIATTQFAEYHEQDGVRFPAEIECVFPLQKARMVFKIRNPRFNRSIPESLFHIDREEAMRCGGR